MDFEDIDLANNRYIEYIESTWVNISNAPQIEEHKSCSLKKCSNSGNVSIFNQWLSLTMCVKNNGVIKYTQGIFLIENSQNLRQNS